MPRATRPSRTEAAGRNARKRSRLFYATREFKKRGWKPPTHRSDLLDEKYCGRVGINHPNVAYGAQALIMLDGSNPAKINDDIAKLTPRRQVGGSRIVRYS